MTKSIDPAKFEYFGEYRVNSGRAKQVFRTKYKNGSLGKFWVWTGQGSNDQPSNRRYINGIDDMRHIVKRDPPKFSDP